MLSMVRYDDLTWLFHGYFEETSGCFLSDSLWGYYLSPKGTEFMTGHFPNSFRNSCLWNMILADFLSGNEWKWVHICNPLRLLHMRQLSGVFSGFFTSRAWRGLPLKWQPKQWIKSRTLPCKGQGGWELGAMGGQAHGWGRWHWHTWIFSLQKTGWLE